LRQNAVACQLTPQRDSLAMKLRVSEPSGDFIVRVGYGSPPTQRHVRTKVLHSRSRTGNRCV